MTDHTDCCGPDSAYAARQYLTSSGEHSYRAYEWRRQIRDQGYVQLHNGYDSRSTADAILCERPSVNAIALRWDQNTTPTASRGTRAKPLDHAGDERTKGQLSGHHLGDLDAGLTALSHLRRTVEVRRSRLMTPEPR